MEYFLKRYPNFIFLKKNLSHNEIFNNHKILCALTVYGSIAHEYPLFNIPVINACINNSHSKYNFSYSPKTINAFKKLIINCEKLKVKKKNDIYKFYYLRYLTEYYFLDNFLNIIVSLQKQCPKKNITSFFSEEIFKIWLNKFNSKLHDKKIKHLEDFIESKKFRMIADNTSNKSNPIHL